MLAHRLRRRPNINPTLLVQYPVFVAWYSLSLCRSVSNAAIQLSISLRKRSSPINKAVWIAEDICVSLITCCFSSGTAGFSQEQHAALQMSRCSHLFLPRAAAFHTARVWLQLSEFQKKKIFHEFDNILGKHLIKFRVSLSVYIERDKNIFLDHLSVLLWKAKRQYICSLVK